jgi:hypothetical protein
MIKINDTGDLQWEKSIGGSDFDVNRSILKISENEFKLAGTTSSNDGYISGNHGDDDLWLADFEILNTGVNDGTFRGCKISVAPNPAKNYFALTNAPESSGKYSYTLMDMSGRLVINGTLQIYEKVNIEGIPKGSYIVQIKTGNGLTGYQKLIKE